jgi:hypothetical protein
MTRPIDPPRRRGLLAIAAGAFAMALHLGPCTTDQTPRRRASGEIAMTAPDDGSAGS